MELDRLGFWFAVSPRRRREGREGGRRKGELIMQVQNGICSSSSTSH